MTGPMTGPMTDAAAGPDAAAGDRSPSALAALAEQVAAAVTAHPAVARLDAGTFGAVFTHLPGRRLVGVRIGEPGEPVEIAVVLHLDRPIPEVARALRREVSRMCGGAAVDITVADLELPPGWLP
jgi:hypothetical protein